MKQSPLSPSPAFPRRPLAVESLEARIVPSALNVTLGGTATTLIESGDTGDAGPDTILRVNSGQVLAFVTDLNSNGVYDSGELTGIAVGKNANLDVFDDVNGDIATNLDDDGTLSDGGGIDNGEALLANSIAGLSVTGNAGHVLAGLSISNLSITGVTGDIRTGTAAGGQTIDYTGGLGASIALDAFLPGAGEDGGSVHNASLGGLDGVFTGDGGADADGGSVLGLIITADAGGYVIQTGNGGDGDKAGDGGDIKNLEQLAGSGPVTIGLGSGGESLLKNGGDAGEFDVFSIVVNGSVAITGGNGGDGLRNGGEGTEFSDYVIDASAGAGNTVTIDAGNGGNTLFLMPDAKGSGGRAGDILRGSIEASGDVTINGAGGDGGNGTKRSGEGSSVEEIDVISGGSILLIGTDGGNTPTTTGEKGRGGIGGHVTGKLNFFADPSVLEAAGTVTILTGDGGMGGRAGGSAGGVYGFDIDAGGDVTILGGDGGSYDPLGTTSKKGNGGLGSSINTILVSTPADVTILSGNGGGGSSGGTPGGNIGFVQVVNANDVTLIAGAGGGFTDLTLDDDENSESGGAGGSIASVRIDDSEGGVITGDVTLIAGDGYGNAERVLRGGNGGSVVDAVVVTNGDLTILGGQGGNGDVTENNAIGGMGGLIDPMILTAARITIVAGDGGDSSRGGNGGYIEELTLTVSDEASILAGNGGSGNDRDGGDGGDVEKILVHLTGAGFVRAIAAGDGGSSVTDNPGDGGSVRNVEVTGGSGTIGDFTAAYGLAGMGGVFAGAGFRPGDVTDVTATAISNIVAGRGSIPIAALSIDNIAATIIGADLDGDTSFDFDDSASPDGEFEEGTDAPIDGLVLGVALGDITGSTLFTLETKTGDTTGTVDPN